MDDSDDDEQIDPKLFTDASPNAPSDEHLAVLCDALQEHDITRVIVSYDGSGDSGCIAEVEYEPANVAFPAWVDDTLRDVAETYCPDGYENNEGGFGTLTLYPFDGLAVLEHYDRYEGSEAIDTPTAPLPEELFQQLSRLGVISVTVHFDGSGDSGQIEELIVQPPRITLGRELEGELEDFLLDQLPGGWENNMGCSGDFVVNVPAGIVEVDASWRVEKEFDANVTRWRWRQ